MNPLRGIIVGAGYFARFHAEAWARLPSARIMAAVDNDPSRAAEFARAHVIPKAYDKLADALAAERPDFVDITTRPSAHLALTHQAASAGVHVICQKPMADSMVDCIAMREVCEQAGVRLLIHENWRWQPWYREAKRLVAAGLIGQPFQYSFQWRTGDGKGSAPYLAQPYFREMPRLLIHESLVHLLDTFRFLGGECEVVSCQTARLNPVITGEDQAAILLRFHDGATGFIDGNRITGPVPSPVAMGTCKIEGMEGTLQITPEGRLVLVRSEGPCEQIPWEPPAQGYKGDSVLATQRHLIDCLQTGSTCESEGRDYLKTFALVEACYNLSGEPRGLAGVLQPREGFDT